MNELFKAGKLLPVIEGSYKLADVPEAGVSMAWIRPVFDRPTGLLSGKGRRMTNTWRVVSCALIMSSIWSQASAQESWAQDQREVLAAIDRLSAATAPGGEGAEAYAAVLADEFSRWTIGSTVVNEKQEWVAGLGEWLDDGWRVSDRQAQVLEILVRGDYAFTRRIVEESYVGPENEHTGSKAALAEVWVRSDRGWLLLRVNVHPLDNP